MAVVRYEFPKSSLIPKSIYLTFPFTEKGVSFHLDMGEAMKRYILLFITALVILSVGCATKPSKIQPTYVSPLQYQSYDCLQIIAEMGRVGRRTGELYQHLKKEADADSAQMGIGMIIFWPALFALEGGDGPEATEYARLLGEREALEKMAIQKKCDQTLWPPDQIAPKGEIAEDEKENGDVVESKTGEAEMDTVKSSESTTEVVESENMNAEQDAELKVE